VNAAERAAYERGQADLLAKLAPRLEQLATELTDSGNADNHTFDMCPGPEAPLVHMLTCQPCAAAIELREILAEHAAPVA
jgi:hypothetical protein